MFDKPFSTLFGIGLFIWIGMILFESTPAARLHSACSPVRWGGNVMQSLAALSDSDRFIEKVAVGTDEVDYGCQFTLWRLVYGKEYAKSVGEKGARPRSSDEFDEAVLPPGGITGDVGRETVAERRHDGADQEVAQRKNKVVLVDKTQEQ